MFDPSDFRNAHNGGDLQPLTDRRYTVNGFDSHTNTNSTASYVTAAPPVDRIVTNWTCGLTVTTWTTSSAYPRGNIASSAKRLTSSNPSRNMNENASRSPCLPCKPSSKRTRLCNLSLPRTPSSGTNKGLPVVPTRPSRQADHVLRVQECRSLGQQMLLIFHRPPTDLHRPARCPRSRRLLQYRRLHHFIVHRSASSRALSMHKKTHLSALCHLLATIHRRTSPRETVDDCRYTNPQRALTCTDTYCTPKSNWPYEKATDFCNFTKPIIFPTPSPNSSRSTSISCSNSRKRLSVMPIAAISVISNASTFDAGTNQQTWMTWRVFLLF